MSFLFAKRRITMFLFKNDKPASIPKRQISVIGILTEVLRPGSPVTYLYNGNLIRTSTVQAILEASSSHVRFETKKSIYTICYNNPPGRDLQVIA